MDSKFRWFQLKEGQVDEYDHLSKFPDLFDFSNLPKSHKCYSENNKGIAGVLKLETPGYEVMRMIALSPKSYSLLCIDEKGQVFEPKNACKGIKNYKRKQLTFEQYEHVLREGGATNVHLNVIRSYDQELYIVRNEKCVLSSFSTKSFLLPPDGIKALPYGHYKIRLIQEAERNE